MAWTCPSCSKPNRPGAKFCQECGAPQSVPTPAPRVATAATTRCPYDGAELLETSGICSATGGYPYGAPCPFACPTCRSPLAWSGLCDRCHAHPGARWDMYDDDGKPLGDGQHWLLQSPAPADATTPAHAPTPIMSAACALIFRAFCSGLLTKPAALDGYAEVFAHPDRAPAIAEELRAKLEHVPARPARPGPQRLGDLIRGLGVDPAVRAALQARQARP